jgi:DNA-binding transcriptional ArsR family regulator
MVRWSSIVSEISCCRYEDFVGALASETRQVILGLLKDQEMSVGDIAARFSLTQSTISHHLAVLRRARVVLARREGQYIYYSANRCCLNACTRRLVETFTKRDIPGTAGREGPCTRS